MKTFWIITIWLLYFTLCSCNKHPARIDANQVDSILFYTMRKGVEFSHGIHSLERLKRYSRDTIITDRAFIEQYVDLVNQLSPKGPFKPWDFRSASIIIMKDGKEHCLCFGESSGIDYDNNEMEDTRAIFDFIDGHVYAPHSWRYWCDDEEIRLVEWLMSLEQ